MNKEYMYIDGKVVISDENGKQTLTEYSDNLDAILAQENVIETMENRILELEKDSQFYKKNSRKHYIPTELPITVLMATVGINLFSYFLSDTNPFITSVDTVFGVVNEAVLYSSLFAIIFIPIGAIYEVRSYRQYKNEKRRKKGTNSELEFLQKQIIEEKQVLEDLKKKKKRDEENKKFRVVKVDDKQQLQALKSNLSLYFDLGYNGEKYFRYFQQGKLDAKLRKHYNDTGIEIAKKYLEEKGPTLVKRKKQNNQNNL